MAIQKVAVIGSGVMGSGIAAQVANAGIPVVLLDIVPKNLAEGEDRSKIAKGAIEKLLKQDPAPLMSTRNAKLITPGNLEDDLKLIEDCDWIVEVVLEDLKIKHVTYEKLVKHMKKGAILSSNTSTIPLEMLTEPLSKDVKKNFMITHFFNPPRYLRLLEIVVGKDTDPNVVKEVSEFCDVKLGKGVVKCKDTPGFIVNRILTFFMQSAMNVAVKDGVSIEVADAVLSKPVGIPKTGVFGLIDLVGVDLMPHLAESLLSTLPKDDPYRTIYQDYPFIEGMIKAGYTGRKGKGGFYRLGEGKVKQALKLSADRPFDEAQYAAADKPKLASMDAGKKGLRAVVTAEDEGGQYAWKVLRDTLVYAASLVPDIADSVAEVDEAMRLGTNWKSGPFEMIDALGASWFAAKLKEEGIAVPKLLQAVGEGSFYKVENGKLMFFGTDGKYHAVPRSQGVLLLSDIKLNAKPVIKTGSAAVWDIGDGVLCVEFTGKMNALDDQVFEAYSQAIKMITKSDGAYKAMVIYNEGSNFSAGANLGLAVFAMNIALWPQIDELVSGGQKIYKALKYAPFPVVAAPSGMALGGGCEILLHADHVQAHAETYCGLVEVGVGLIPGWGGCKEMLLRYQAEEREQFDKNTGGRKMWFSPKNTPMGAVRKAFETIAMARVAKSAQEAKEIKYLKKTDGITMNRDRLLFDAKAKALELAKDYKVPEPVTDIRLPGPSGKLALDMAVADMAKSGKATPYDIVVSGAVARVLSGGDKADWTKPMNEDDLYKLEREEFTALVRNEGTQKRVEHMLEKGKPLRN
ncbi:MAG: 3-hydroxyacyl-CoA dehydrogenase [Micavibrio aeruginosavorus]|uniref:3-hydroxyacyl-CoA dehydrogenase n=1 Tax=Micavibrio aeruginosavorus TaxID=349221 RepID=A0A2W5PWF1_9BACT|nr:MAG: 3-hydroxyacyl-CoA dehydrogenase [Micavibrio aeruginosavorus]